MIDVEHAIHCAVQDLRDAAEGLVNHCDGEQDLNRRINEIEQISERVRLGQTWFLCKRCDGTGRQRWDRQEKPHYSTRPCWRCAGSGVVNGLDDGEAPCPCGDPNGGPPCTFERPCIYGQGKTKDRWR